VNDRPLEGRGAVVTGGSRGIGAAAARALAEAGASVVVAARPTERLEATAEALRAVGARAWAVSCDVTDPAQIEALRNRAIGHLGSVDILVNNAGAAPSAPFGKIALDDWNALLALNVTGPFLCTQAFLPGMLERGWGRVVNVASVAAKEGAPYIAAYVASKHALLGMTRALGAEVAARGVTVNAVCPGYVDSEMTDRSVSRMVEKTGRSAEELRERLEAMSPQGRLMEVEEVAYLIASLCDPRAKGINAQSIVLDGGRVQG
jgi:NAD(P)-dependent dehydrogenase (short-subunit alcohol dehydrogenase family)